ncbi:MAG: HDIG domain-containing protein [Nitrososphaerota archaeon]|nr:HDIG domain-containing protein [Candidatus Bathyarchaeota archaeon]MDW8048413.1 HDIG domain-containing protein [Nitrososphaerota archaeon]
MLREDAIELINSKVKNRNVLRHMLAVGAIMKNLAKYLNEDEYKWELTGLLHDIDYEETCDNFIMHGIVACEMLKGKVKDEILRAIRAHNEATGTMPESLMEKGLIAADAVSGLLIACALVMPSKNIQDVDIKTVKKKFKDKDFARGADRKRISKCEELGIPLEKFLEISLEGLKSAEMTSL